MAAKRNTVVAADESATIHFEAWKLRQTLASAAVPDRHCELSASGSVQSVADAMRYAVIEKGNSRVSLQGALGGLCGRASPKTTPYHH